MKTILRIATLCCCLVTTSNSWALDPIQVSQPDEQSLLEKLKEIQELRKQGVADPITLQLPPGEIRITETIQLTPEIVGNGLRIEAKESGTTSITSGIALQATGKNEQGQWIYPLPENWSPAISPRVLLISGKLTSAARYPDSGYLRIESALPDRRSGFVYHPDDISASLDLNQGLCDLILLHDWSSSRLPVQEINHQARELKTVGPIGCEAKHYAIDHFEKQPRYWLEGHPEFANLPGEWYIDREQKKLFVVGSPDQTQPPQVELPSLMELLTAVGEQTQPIKNLILQGIIFSGSQFPMPVGGLAGAQATMHEPRDENGHRTTRHRPMLPAAVRLEVTENCRIQNCQFESLGATGLWLGESTKNAKILRCQFTDLGGNGINLGEDNSRRVDGKSWYQSRPEQISKGNLISECRISHCGQILPGAVGIWVPLSDSIKIVNNHLHDCPYTGISLGWIWNQTNSPAKDNLIAENKIEFMMQVLSDGGGIYTLGRQPGSVMEKNVITDIPLNAGRAESNGMFLDQGSTGFTIQNNEFRRIDRSPLRFHQAGNNSVANNRWELATSSTPPVRFNNTPQENIAVGKNETLSPQTKIFLIGNSLTWDTIPSKLDETVHWHVDCGKSLKYILENPKQPCVGSSRLWPVALKSMQYDYVSVQPHYGTNMEEDLMVISHWLEMQPQAKFIIHTGWARSAELVSEFADSDPSGPLTHSPVYFDTLMKRLKESYPERTFLTTGCSQLLYQIHQDIQAGKAPIDKLEQMYRDAIHMDTGPGRYLMHNQMRMTLGQPKRETGFPDFDPELKKYLDHLLEQDQK